MDTHEPRRKRDRPVVRQMPEPSPAPPEDVARAIMQGPPKQDWDFLKSGGAGYSSPEPPKRRSPKRRWV